EARRVDKIAGIVSHPLAIRHMRVCLKNQGRPDNCGHCQKCARTMMALDILGRLSEVPTFPPVSRETLARWVRGDNPIFVQELLDFARRTGNETAFEFLSRIVRSQKRRHAVKALIETTPIVADVMPKMNELRRRLRGDRPIGAPAFLGLPVR